MKNNKFYDLAVEGSGLAKDLGYEAEPELKCKSAGEFVRAWLEFMIENRDEPAFILRVNNVDNLPALLRWCLAVQGALSVG